MTDSSMIDAEESREANDRYFGMPGVDVERREYVVTAEFVLEAVDDWEAKLIMDRWLEVFAQKDATPFSVNPFVTPPVVRSAKEC